VVGEGHFKPIRVEELQADTRRYVPTKENLADHLTRGTTLMELSQLKDWWKGPAFLSDNQDHWSLLETVLSSIGDQRELKRGIQRDSQTEKDY